jgi:hypothetical protein
MGEEMGTIEKEPFTAYKGSCMELTSTWRDRTKLHNPTQSSVCAADVLAKT